MSICTILIIVIISLESILNFSLKDVYQETSLTEQLTYKNDITYKVKNEEAMIAFSFVNSDTNDRLELEQVDSYLRYHFV